jgi:hypothetical protein
MQNYFLIIFFIAANICSAQSPEYAVFIKKADSLYKVKNYLSSAEHYSYAFRANGWKGMIYDRYSAACAWVLAGNADSAFFQLNRIATKGNFSDYAQLTTDKDLAGLYPDKRWQPLVELVRLNRDRTEPVSNRPLADQLDSIHSEDQKYRNMVGDIEKQYGYNSKEMQNLWKTINEKDSINLIKVTSILDKFGWLGPNIVGSAGNITLFLVIQHSNQKIQEKYLPMMREAVKNGSAQASALALLEDRVALGQGKKQIYGSQIHRDEQTGKYFVAPIEDEANVNIRRAAVGLEPLEHYAKQWNIDYKLPVK